MVVKRGAHMIHSFNNHNLYSPHCDCMGCLRSREGSRRPSADLTLYCSIPQLICGQVYQGHPPKVPHILLPAPLHPTPSPIPSSCLSPLIFYRSPSGSSWSTMQPSCMETMWHCLEVSHILGEVTIYCSCSEMAPLLGQHAVSPYCTKTQTN